MSAFTDMAARGEWPAPPGLALTAPPAAEPVTLDEAKAYLRVVTADEDALLTRLIAVARQAAERSTGRALITQDWRLTLDRWPPSRVLELPFPPLRSISAVVRIDAAGAENVWPSDGYLVDAASEPGRVALPDGAPPPVPGRDLAGLAVDFTAGYGDQPADVPEALRQAIIRLAAHAFEHRDDPRAGVLPAGIEALLAPYRAARL